MQVEGSTSCCSSLRRSAEALLLEKSEALFLNHAFSGRVHNIGDHTLLEQIRHVSAYAKLRGHGPAYLLESVEGGERLSRYSFIGCRPRKVIACGPQESEIRERGRPVVKVPTPPDP